MKQLKQTELIFPFTAISKYTNIWSLTRCFLGTQTLPRQKKQVWHIYSNIQHLFGMG